MAAAASCRCSSVVFVGNIPYHASEAELRAACEEIGPVVSLRVAVATDSSNSRPRHRGFAFVEYLDDETALSACRNLHGRALRGRDLRVGLAQRATPPRGGVQGDGDGDGDEPVGVEEATHAASLLAPGAARPRGAVTSYLAGLSRRQLRELLDALEREDAAALVEHAKREFAGLSTLIEQARVLLHMASAPGVAGKNKKRGAGAGMERPGDSSLEAAAQATKLRRLQDGVPGVAYR